MRRRVESNGERPPETLTDYRLWCAKHGRRAYGDPKRPDTMATARRNWEAWEALRQTWARQHGLDDGLDVPMAAAGCDEPWDDDWAI